VRETEPWHRLPSKAVESPFLEILKSYLDKATGSRCPSLSRGDGPADLHRSLPTSIILGYCNENQIKFISAFVLFNLYAFCLSLYGNKYLK